MNARYFYENMLWKSKKYSIVDTHCFNSLKEGIIKPSKETVVTAWIFAIFIILIALLHFIMMTPLRLFTDIKNCFRDFLKGMSR